MLKTFSGRPSEQNENELGGLVSLLVAEGIYAYGEIGARHGDTFYEIVSSLPRGAKGVACAYFGERIALERVIVSLKAQGYKASALFGDSRTLATLQLFHGRGPFDAVAINDDTSEAAETDWSHYRSLARIVVFYNLLGISKFWKEVKATGIKTVEFVAPKSTIGIGVVFT